LGEFTGLWMAPLPELCASGDSEEANEANGDRGGV
jgi:hypothetical protein